MRTARGEFPELCLGLIDLGEEEANLEVFFGDLVLLGWRRA